MNDDGRNLEDEIDAECEAELTGGYLTDVDGAACTAVRRVLLRTLKALRGQVEVRERMAQNFGRVVEERDNLRAALKATNEEIIRYGMTAPEAYNWLDMTARTRANEKLIGGDQ